MGPTTASQNRTIPLDTSNGPIIFVQGSDSPWALDLNTLVTIVFGIITIAFQAQHMYYERAQQKRAAELAKLDLENGGERLLAHNQKAQFTTWPPEYDWVELEEYQNPEAAARGQPVSVTPTRSGVPRHVFRRDGGGQIGGTGYLPPGYVYSRVPRQYNDREGDPGPRLTPTGATRERHFAPHQRPGLR